MEKAQRRTQRKKLSVRRPIYPLLFPLLLTVLSTVLFSTAVHAELVLHTYTNDFSFTTQSLAPLKACSCEAASTTYTVVNTGNFPTAYTVTVESQDPFYTPSATRFVLAPGERTDFSVRAEPPCGWTGSSTSEVRVTSSYGRDRTLSRELVVLDCQNIQLAVDGPETASVLSPAEFTVRIKNVADFRDDFELHVTPNGQVRFDADRWAPLNPDEERIIHATYLPVPDEQGDKQLTFTVTSGKSGHSVSTQRTLTISNDYTYELVMEPEAALCSRVTNTVPLTVRNTYGAENTFTLSVEGPSFLEQQHEEFTLAGNEERTFTLSFTPQPGDEGTTQAHVSVTALHGAATEEQTLTLTTNDCYAFSTSIAGLPDNSDTTCCGEHTYTLNVRNDGLDTANYEITIAGPSWILPEERFITLAPKENKNVRVFADLPCVDASHAIPITVTNIENGVSENLTLTLNSQTPQTCHAVAVEPQQLTITPETPVITFIVRNEGSEAGTYTPLVDARLYEGAVEDSLTLAPGEEGLVHLRTRGNLTAYERGIYLGTLSLIHENARYEHTFWTTLRPVSWLTKTGRAIIGFLRASTACFWVMALLALLVVIALLSLLFFLFGVGTKTHLSEHELFVTRTVLLIALFATLIILGLFGTPSEQGAVPAGHEGPVLEWYEGEPYAVNLSRYFADPDEDTLVFTATKPQYIDVEIQGEIATLTPQQGFTGWDRVVFTASDMQGGVTDSPFVGLMVKEREPSFFAWTNHYCLQINLWLLALLLFLLLLISIVRQPHSETLIIEPPRPPRRTTRKAIRRAPQRTSEGSKRRVSRSPSSRPRRRQSPSRRSPARPARVDAKRETALVASKNGDKVHDPQCLLARRIPKQNRVGFSSKAAAVKRGYIPCRVCQPFD